MTSDSDHHSQYFKCFSELYDLYDEVKEIILLAEYENKEKKFLIASVNELRNSLDHIMRSLPDPDNMAKHFDKAKGHIYRAGYDAYEIIALAKIGAIMNVKEQFSYEAIIEAYPKYHSHLIPLTELAKSNLVSARSHKEIDKEVKKSSKEKKYFNDFEAIVKDLIEIVDDLNLHLQGIKEAQDNIRERQIKRERQETRKKIIWTIIGVILTILFLYFEYNIVVPHSRQSSNVPGNSKAIADTVERVDTSK